MLDSDLRDRILDEQIFKNGLNTCLQKAEHSPKSILKIIEESMTTDHGRVMVANLGIEEDLRRISGTESIPQVCRNTASALLSRLKQVPVSSATPQIHQMVEVTSRVPIHTVLADQY